MLKTVAVALVLGCSVAAFAADPAPPTKVEKKCTADGKECKDGKDCKAENCKAVPK